MKNDELLNEAIRNMRNRTAKLEREGDYWSEEDKRRLVEMFKAGHGISEIAIRLQRSEPAVCRQIEKMDLYGRAEKPRRRRKQDKRCGCLCDVCQLDPSACARCGRCKSRKEETEC